MAELRTSPQISRVVISAGSCSTMAAISGSPQVSTASSLPQGPWIHAVAGSSSHSTAHAATGWPWTVTTRTVSVQSWSRPSSSARTPSAVPPR